MKFITEEDLRARYRDERFTSYQMEPGTRLTPGARQYLSDVGIRLSEEDRKPQKRYAPCSEEEPKENQDLQSVSHLYKREWDLALRTIQARFLETGTELLSLDVLMAQEILELERALSEIGNTEPNKSWRFEEHKKEICSICSGISLEHAGDEMPDCFEITGFHAQSPKGREIVKLHLLRCELREFSHLLPDEKKMRVNQVINRLSQMICQAFGGKICQKN